MFWIIATVENENGNFNLSRLKFSERNFFSQMGVLKCLSASDLLSIYKKNKLDSNLLNMINCKSNF